MNRITFSQFLNEDRFGREPRSKEISFTDINFSEYSDALKYVLKKSPKLYRGTFNNVAPLSEIKPSQHIRKSANTANYYTAYIDGAPEWKKYPPRSKSIICTNSKKVADQYGNIYIVIPKNGSRFGVCPKFDFWFSFNETFGLEISKDGFIPTIDRFSDHVHVFIKYMLGDKNNVIEIDSYESMLHYFTLADEAIDKIKNDLEIESYAAFFDVYMEDDKAIMGESFIAFMKKYYNEKTKLLDIMKIIFNPTKAGFTIAKSYADLPEDDSHEVWTDSDSLLILEDFYDKFIERVKNEIS